MENNHDLDSSHQLAKIGVCPGSLKCPEIDALGELNFVDETAWNIAVNDYCGKCQGTDTSARLDDRPTICQGCPTFENGCEGSNQEDCGHRLDDKELRERLLKILADWSGQEVWNTLDEERHRKIFIIAEEIIALLKRGE